MPSIAHANMLLLFPFDPQKLNSICLLRHLVQQESGNSSLYHQRQRILVGAVLTCSAGHGHVLGPGSGHVPLLLLRQQTEQLSGEQCTRLQTSLKWSAASALSKGIPKDIQSLQISRSAPGFVLPWQKAQRSDWCQHQGNKPPLSWASWTQDIALNLSKWEHGTKGA